MTTPALAPIRRVEPIASAWRSVVWRDGMFDTARRSATALVEGTIRTHHHLILATLRGGAAELQVTTDCGHHYRGPERSGAVSFVPAYCERRLRMRDVRAEWASIAIDPRLCEGFELRPFTNAEDPVLAGLAAELLRLLDQDGRLDALYCEAIGLACARYLTRRYGQPAAPPAGRAMKLAPWQVRRIEAHVEAHLADGLRIANLAALLGLSEGHFHRAFRATTGMTPLAFVNQARMRRASMILATEPLTGAEVAARVGFASASHFARLFRAATGTSPTGPRRR
jgi:AraC family transcriptional regulator